MELKGIGALNVLKGKNIQLMKLSKLPKIKVEIVYQAIMSELMGF